MGVGVLSGEPAYVHVLWVGVRCTAWKAVASAPRLALASQRSPVTRVPLQRGIVCGVGDGDGHALNNPLARPPGDEGHALVEPVADAVAGGREVLPAQFPV